jgi:hypothetical protein
MSHGRLFAHLLIFFIVSALEVQVHAEQILTLSDDKDIVEEPKRCLVRAMDCAIETSKNKRFSFFVGENKITMDEKTILIRNQNEQITFFQGRAWFQISKPTVVKTAFGEVALEQGDIWFESQGERVQILNQSGKPVVLKMKGSKDSPILPEGFLTWISEVQASRVQIELPQSVNTTIHLKNWARLYKGDKLEFKKNANEWVQVMREVASVSGQAKEKLAQEWQHQQEERRAREERQVQAEREEEDALRALFRERNFIK